jgi:cytochrome c oxidase subunit 3
MTVESHAHAAPPHLAHHFDTPTQQFESGKLGMWLFLGTELLMFGGLFCAYTIFRASHPDVFAYAHRFLDVKLGAINTVVLICSSFTMAWGVHAAQVGRRKLLVAMLSLTLLCAFGFLGIKVVEYTHKIRHGLMWGTNYRSQEMHAPGPGGASAERIEAPVGPATHPAAGVEHVPAPGGAAERSVVPPAASAPAGLAKLAPADEHAARSVPANPHLFFGLYFAMTGLHGIHVLAGILVIGWLLVGASRGAYGPAYFTPVDLVGLYWHVVDLIWIFLFPLLYLIH